VRIQAGDHIGPYEVVASLGGGGMGLVFKARDPRLERFVAIKVLAPELTRDENAKQRFIQEAKAAPALDHPSICTIYDIGETDDGQIYLAMAFCDGQNLRQRIDAERIRVDDALEIAIQMADGLADAHAHGIVHRDVKPANVMFTHGRTAKLVDFGLAKLAGQTGLTQSGAAVGTAYYMSPEQTRGDNVDHRTDVWALGVVLYEMITGQAPFHGDSYLAVAGSIARSSPSALTALRTGVPLALERIVERALAKDPADRHQSAADFAAELRQLRLELDRSTTAASFEVAPPSGRPMGARTVAAAATIVLGAVAATWLLLDRPAPPQEIRLTNIRQLTSSAGVEDHPAWSPDGQVLAYAANSDSDVYGGNWDIWVTQLDGGEAVNRTADHTGDDRHPRWSPDGSQIAFWSSRDGGGFFVMPAIGGRPRRVAATGSPATEVSPPQWSPDGSELAVVAYDRGTFIEIFSLDAGASRRVPLGAEVGALDLSWSPDGRFLAYIDAFDLSAQVTRLWMVDADTGEARGLTDGRSAAWSPDWSADSRALYYVSNEAGSMDLWRLRLDADGAPDGVAEPVTSGVGMIRAALAPDGGHLAYSRGRRVANIWRVPILADRPATWDEAEQLTTDQAFIEFLDVSADGTQLIFDSDRNGNPALWTSPVAGGEMRQLTNEEAPDWAPRYSPDGRQIVFYSFRTGNREIWTMPAGGGAPRQITDAEGSDLVPTWAPDESAIAFTSLRTGDPEIWIVPADGGSPRQLTDTAGDDRRADWSPDGEWVTFVSERSGALRLWRATPDGAEAEQLTEGPAYFPRWSPDGRHVYFTAFGERTGNLWGVSVDDGVERPITDLTGRRGSIGQIAIATDGDYLYFTWEDHLGDIWVADVGPTRADD
jgi:Tol biopolymer transport system component/serine/threonine protein kinase